MALTHNDADETVHDLSQHNPGQPAASAIRLLIQQDGPEALVLWRGTIDRAAAWLAGHEIWDGIVQASDSAMINEALAEKVNFLRAGHVVC